MGKKRDDSTNFKEDMINLGVIFNTFSCQPCDLDLEGFCTLCLGVTVNQAIDSPRGFLCCAMFQMLLNVLKQKL